MQKFDYTPEEIEKIMENEQAWKALLEEAVNTLTEGEREKLESSQIRWRDTVECFVRDLYEPPSFCDIVRSGINMFGIEHDLDLDDIWPERFNPNDEGMYFRVYEYYLTANKVLVQTYGIPNEIIEELKSYLRDIAEIQMISC